jgi:hypothetical protein
MTKLYSEKNIRKAVEMTAFKYHNLSEKMSFSEMAIVENVLMTFEMFLFNGDIRPEDIGDGR